GAAAVAAGAADLAAADGAGARAVADAAASAGWAGPRSRALLPPVALPGPAVLPGLWLRPPTAPRLARALHRASAPLRAGGTARLPPARGPRGWPAPPLAPRPLLRPPRRRSGGHRRSPRPGCGLAHRAVRPCPRPAGLA